MSVVDCPALHERHIDKGYPFGDRVPSKIRMLRTVTSDVPFQREGDVLVAVGSTVHNAWTNSYGAVAAVLPDGRKLGVKPGEFEVVEWLTPKVSMNAQGEWEQRLFIRDAKGDRPASDIEMGKKAR
jgi:hypothetical protein